jgi:hypothetical protein
MTEPPSPLRMLLSRHTRRREVITLLGRRCGCLAAGGAGAAGRIRRIGVPLPAAPDEAANHS